MIFTKEHLTDLIAWATYRTSRSLGIVPEEDTMAIEDMVDLISLSKGHRDALQEFVDAYCDWWLFHFQIFSAGNSGKMTPAEIASLTPLILRRDNARAALLALTA